MNRVKIAVRSCGMLMAFVLVFAVSGALADSIGSRDNDHGGSLIKPETVGTSWSSTPFTDQHLDWGFQPDVTFGRSNGLRYGEWFWLDLKDFRDKDTGGGSAGGSNVTATPEPETFLLLANGVAFLLISRRRWLKAQR
jgi:hypothetical protein